MDLGRRSASDAGQQKEGNIALCHAIPYVAHVHPYSVFNLLTRSGVLGDTSVHSFTGDGMLPALVRFLLIFIGISVAMLIPSKSQRWFYVGISSSLMVLGIGLEIDVPCIIYSVPSALGCWSVPFAPVIGIVVLKSR
ncbi:MAG: hypothetical protein IPI00_17760 [Flavobacteriales bacterium]|nr:hypothetical protein [Flavobacteriales bacterium]